MTNIPDMSVRYTSSRGRAYHQRDHITIEHHFQVDIFTIIWDSQLQELNNRFKEDVMGLLILSFALDPKDDYSSFKIEDICDLAKRDINNSLLSWNDAIKISSDRQALCAKLVTCATEGNELQQIYAAYEEKIETLEMSQSALEELIIKKEEELKCAMATIELVATKEHRCLEFEGRLCDDIKGKVVGAMYRDYHKLVEATAHVEAIILDVGQDGKQDDISIILIVQGSSRPSKN
ncbi:uncharacterized protein LOC114259918 [Camellia sinensis]|uniref:uncharacterized protein LOC114259918 n=1 Tax=Camellia sinensis TaxID=4442 RepID=UPI001036AEE7|nr:uncharacterized protein LOC114259918 [Camellia sinensis]